MTNALVPIVVCDPCVERALNWALHLSEPVSGEVELLAIADQDIIEEVRHWLANEGQSMLDPKQIERALIRDIGGLVSATQKYCKNARCKANVTTRQGNFLSIVEAALEAYPRITLWGRQRTHSAPSFHRATDLILRSRVPVLIV